MAKTHQPAFVNIIRPDIEEYKTFKNTRMPVFKMLSFKTDSSVPSAESYSSKQIMFFILIFRQC